jgi:hypothetical protein
MHTRDPSADRFERRRVAAFYDVEVQNATYHRHVFPKHFHDYFVIHVVESGLNAFYCRGRIHYAEPGTVPGS